MLRYLCASESDTIACGVNFGKRLAPNAIVCFFGDLGAGKTTFIKGLAQGYAHIPPNQVNSPTFVYLNTYNGTKSVCHFDLYRLKDSDEFISMGFDDVFYGGNVCCIEWSERIENLLPENHIKVTMQHQEGGVRLITIEGMDEI